MYMKYQFINIGFLPLLLFLLPFFLCTCADEEPVGPLPGDFKTVDFHLLLKGNGEDSNSTQYEGMEDVFLVITDSEGVILQTHSEVLKEENNNMTVFEKTIRLEDVPKEAAYVYAFSNLKSELLTNSDEILAALEVGKKLPVTFNVEGALVGMPHARIKEDLVIDNGKEGTEPKTPPIPMSSHFHELREKEISIPLYRMVAKVKVSISNKMEDNFATTVDVSKFRNRDSIYTLPYKSLLNDIGKIELPLFPNGTTSLNPVWGILNNAVVVGGGAPVEKVFYVHETSLGKDSIKVDVKITKPKNETKTGVTNFTYVRRNDYLIIPLVLSEYALNVSVSEQRAPIGGYPFAFQLDLISSREYQIKNTGVLTIHLEAVKKALGSTDTEVNFTIKDCKLISEDGAITWLNGSEPEDLTEVKEVKLMVHRKGTATLSFTVEIANDSKTNIDYEIKLIY